MGALGAMGATSAEDEAATGANAAGVGTLAGGVGAARSPTLPRIWATGAGVAAGVSGLAAETAGATN